MMKIRERQVLTTEGQLARFLQPKTVRNRIQSCSKMSISNSKMENSAQTADKNWPLPMATPIKFGSFSVNYKKVKLVITEAPPNSQTVVHSKYILQVRNSNFVLTAKINSRNLNEKVT